MYVCKIPNLFELSELFLIFGRKVHSLASSYLANTLVALLCFEEEGALAVLGRDKYFIMSNELHTYIYVLYAKKKRRK